MAELKPRLIITSRGRKRRGFGTFITVLIIFALGFYAGYKYGDYLFGDGLPEVSMQNQEPGDTLEQEVLSVEQKDPASEKSDVKYSERTDATGGQEGFVIGEFLTSEVPGDKGSYSDSDPGGIDQQHFKSDLDNTSQDMVLENSVTARSENETDALIEDAATSASASYTLQVGAFSTPEEARAVVESYKSKGYQAYLVPIENSRGERWNLVKIGKFNTIDQAWSYASYFNNREGVEAYVESIERGTEFNESWSGPDISDQ